MNNLKDRYLSIWWETSAELHKTGEEVSFVEKLRNERKVERFRKKLFATLKQITEEDVNKENWRKQVITQIKEMESNLSNYSISIIDFFIESGYGNITEEFIKEVKEFDPKMEIYDIFQAIRNVWIMNSIQILFNMDVRLTPSIFAYSMLYPYSDNYLDDSNFMFEEKIRFNKKFEKWLLGEMDNPLNIMEQNIYNLVKKIESEFDRYTYPEVFKSLLAIHKAQEQSLIQQKELTLPYEKDIIGISFEKGGTSVLADAYLVRGILEINEANFMFTYGIILQLIDDLQDVDEDFGICHMTIFSQLMNKYPFERLINKLINYINNLFDYETNFTSEKALTLKRIIKDCCYIMILEAISKNKNRFSKEYLKQIESSSIVRFSYLKKVKKTFQKTFSSEDIINICSLLAKSD